MDLDLNQVELETVQSSWADMPSKKRFFTMLYSNLIIQNPKLSKLFNNDNDLVEEHTLSFNDLFSYIIIHLRNLSMIDEFMVRFVEENDKFCQLACKYLDTMGNSFLYTFRQILDEGFDKDMELAWIRVYVFVANYILKLTEVVDDKANDSDDSEANDINDSGSVSSGEIAPLNLNKGLPSLPKKSKRSRSAPPKTPPRISTPSAPTIEEDSDSEHNKLDAETISTIKFLLSSNSKYRGFRRSPGVSKDEPITVSIPKSNSFTKTERISPISASLSAKLKSSVTDVEPFDPKKIPLRSPSFISVKSQLPITNESDKESLSGDSSDEYEEIHKMKEHRDQFVTPKEELADPPQFRSSLLQQLKEKKKEFVVSESESESEDGDGEKPTTPKSPVKEATTTPFDPRKRTSKLDQLVKQTSPASVKEELSSFKPPLQIPDRSPARIRSASPDCYIPKGLPPIVESEVKQHKSTNSDVSSSRTSSLSLHGSDSGLSSVSSTGYDTSFHKPIVESTPQPQHPLNNLCYSSSTPSLTPDLKPNKVSLGFMKTSFVLRKEIDEFGFNVPENVSTTTTTMNTQNLNKSLESVVESLMFNSHPVIPEGNESICSFEDAIAEEDDDEVDDDLCFAKVAQQYNIPKDKPSIKRRLSTIFSRKAQPKPLPPRRTNPSSRTSSITSKVVHPQDYSLTQSNRRPSKNSLFSSSSNLVPPRKPFTPSIQSSEDSKSVGSSDSKGSISGFSFLKKGEKDIKYTPPSVRRTMKGNKYEVKKSPYIIFA